jgi:hypothetical protein
VNFLLDNFWLYLVFWLSVGSHGDLQTDLLSMVPTDGYLQHHELELTTPKMLEVAKTSPTDPKGIAQQLLAIRWFGENRDKLGDQRQAVKAALETLAQAPAGFARDYAALSLARIDGKPLPQLRTMPQGSVRGEALAWFPDDVSLVGSIDFRAPLSAQDSDIETSAAAEQARRTFLSAIPKEAIQNMFRFVDQIGNFRIDRAAFASCPDPTGQRKDRIYIRVTGQGDAKRLIEAVAGNLQNAKTEERKGPNGIRVRVMTQPGSMVFAFIGDSDLLACGFEDARTKDSAEVFDQVMAIMNGKSPSVVKGPLAATLQTVPDSVRGMFIGAVPDELRRELSRSSLGLAPLSVAVHLIAAKDRKGSEFHVRASFANDTEAKTFVEGIQAVVKQGSEGLKMLPFKIKPESMTALQKALGEVEIKAVGSGIVGRTPLAPSTLLALADLFEAAVKNSK